VNHKKVLTVKRLGFVIKRRNADASRLAVEIAKYAARKGVVCVFAGESEQTALELRRALSVRTGGSKLVKIIAKEKLSSFCDLIAVFGGDGTYLSIARHSGARAVPIVGINMGHLGFLTEIKHDEAMDIIEQILGGHPVLLSKRRLLDVTLSRKSRVIYRGTVINDAVISKGAIARIISTQISINGRPINTIRADGLIVCTPTGSTAYSLAAGGPILEPSVPAIVISAICPHSLTQRPLVIPEDSEVQICLSQRPGAVLLTLDGQDAVSMNEGDIVTIRGSKRRTLGLVCSPERDYFSLLREKLKFGSRDRD